MKKFIFIFAIGLAVSGITTAYAGIGGFGHASDLELSCEAKLAQSEKSRADLNDTMSYLQSNLDNTAAQCRGDKNDLESTVASLSCQLDCYKPHSKPSSDGSPIGILGSGGVFGGSDSEAPSCPQKPGTLGPSLLNECDAASKNA